MTQSNHSPGPWIAGRPATGMDPTVHRYVHTQSGDLVASVNAGYAPDRGLTKQLEANANLIASAPDLYEALKECLPLVGYETADLHREHALGNESAMPILRARAALAKAEGRTP